MEVPRHPKSVSPEFQHWKLVAAFQNAGETVQLPYRPQPMATSTRLRRCQLLAPLKAERTFLEKGHKEIIFLARGEVFHGLHSSVQHFSYLL